MASETKMPQNLSRGDKMDIHGKVLTVRDRRVWNATRAGGHEEMRFIEVIFEAYETPYERVVPLPIFVPIDKVVEVVK